MRRITPTILLALLAGACTWLAPEEVPEPRTPVHASANLEAIPPATARGTASLDGTTNRLLVDGFVGDVPEGTYALHLLPPGRCEHVDLGEAVALLEPEGDARVTPTWVVLPEEAYEEGAILSDTVRVEGLGPDEDLGAWRLVVTRTDGSPEPVPVSCGRVRPVRVPGA